MKNNIKDFLVVSLGACVSAIAIDLFLAPSEIAPGGISGLAISINYLSHIPLGVLIFLLNIPIFILGLMRFGKKFIIRSFSGMLLFSVFTDIFAFLPRITNDLLLSAICGGVLMGFGIGLVFGKGYTTGGTDILVRILRQRHPSFSIGRLVLIIDAVIICIAGIIFKKWEVLLYSAVSLYISSFIIDVIVEGGDSAKIVYIISEFPERMAKNISKDLERGTTHLHASSFYTNQEKAVLLCVIKKYEIAKLKDIIKETDSSAFVIFSDAREVLGNGFKSY